MGTKITHNALPSKSTSIQISMLQASPKHTYVGPTQADLRHRDEEKEVDARKNWYQNAKIQGEYKLMICKKISNVGIPIVAGLFITFYWSIGMNQYNS